MSSAPRYRFAPSPTGPLHLGSAVVALANAVAAADGELVLRIDDTDRQRSSSAAEQEIVEQLEWLGIKWTTGPVRQSERSRIYEQWLDRLLDSGGAYRCFCSEERLDELREAQQRAGQPSRYDGRCRALATSESQRRATSGEANVVRVRIADSDTEFDDLVHGQVHVPAGSFGDFILRRSDGGFGYLFASVVDDAQMQISIVMRGSDHLPNTARQIALMRQMQDEIPLFAHLPLLTASSGKKLSKRDPLGTLGEVRTLGFSAAAVRTYLWELLGQGTLDPLAQPTRFDPNTVPRSSPHVSLERLRSIAMSQFAHGDLAELSAAVAERLGVSAVRIVPLVEDLRTEHVGIDALTDQIATLLRFDPALIELPATVTGVLATAPTSFEHASELVEAVKKAAKESGQPVGSVLKPLRRALTGQERGPSLAAVLFALDPEELQRRLGMTGPEGRVQP